MSEVASQLFQESPITFGKVRRNSIPVEQHLGVRENVQAPPPPHLGSLLEIPQKKKKNACSFWHRDTSRACTEDDKNSVDFRLQRERL